MTDKTTELIADLRSPNVFNRAVMLRAADTIEQLRDQIDMLIENSVRVEGGPVPWIEIDAAMWDRILSRAIDTKEEKL
ncbi:hypothetical protein [uncultured Microbacterium sp.]|uniref:hypothetical protein n=1 Tax=uncultured Microbacterium sp. TaxID=191216 RepID=UPI0025DF4055|nr:hypothetical protein [uncultured Microbacterium sp.]